MLVMRENLKTKFVQACSEGNVSEFDDILSACSEQQGNELIQFDYYACFHKAAANGHTSIVHKIFEHVIDAADKPFDQPGGIFPPNEAVIPIFSSRDGEGFKAALMNHHVNTANRILDEEYLYLKCRNIIAQEDKFIKLAWELGLKFIICHIFADACATSTAAVNRILKIIPKTYHKKLLICQNGWPFRYACRSGNLDIIRLLWQLSDADIRNYLFQSIFPAGIIDAAKNNQLELMKHLLEWANPQQKINCLRYEDYNSFVYAADRGYLDIVKFVYQHLPATLKGKAISASNFAAYRLATQNKHRDVVAFLEEIASDELIQKMKKALTQSALYKN